jgi:hypothetical protein
MRSRVADLKFMGILKALMSWPEALKGAERVFLSCATGFGSDRFEEGQQHHELAKYLCA